eukprot:6165874-Pleurochrysis_carterae.AAC.1
MKRGVSPRVCALVRARLCMKRSTNLPPARTLDARALTLDADSHAQARWTHALANSMKKHGD